MKKEPSVGWRPAGRLLDDQRFVVAALLLLGLGLRVWDLGRRGFWFDELTSLGIAALPFQELRHALTVEGNMTLYYWALFVWLRVVGFGADEATIRSLSAVLGAAAVALTYLLGRRLHSPAAGLASGALIAVNGFHVLMSQEARAYAALSALTILSFLMLDRALTRGRASDWALHGLVSALTFYCHFYTLFTLIAQGIFVLSRRSKTALVGLVGSGAVVLVLTAQLVPFFIHKSGGANLSHVQRPDLNDAVNFLVAYSGGSRGTLLVYAVMALVGIVLARAGARPKGYVNWLLLSWFCLPVGLAFTISLLARPIVEERYLFATLPALPLMAGLGLARLPRAAAVAVVAAVAAISIWSLRGDFEIRRNEQWRQAVAYATARARPDDGWIFISKWGQNGFEYYAGWHWGNNPAAPYEHVLEPFDWYEAFKVPKYRGVLSITELERFSDGHSRIWLVLSHEYDAQAGDVSAPVRDWLTRHGYGVADQRQVSYVRVLEYQRRGSS